MGYAETAVAMLFSCFLHAALAAVVVFLSVPMVPVLVVIVSRVLVFLSVPMVPVLVVIVLAACLCFSRLQGQARCRLLVSCWPALRCSVLRRQRQDAFEFLETLAFRRGATGAIAA